ncbi:unnamed protein product [Rhizoctonia solani]|uniref:Uncharacterized protein n=1 Tax=Rhizoctonia solani TaxID=456999 RepID=A0A8H3CPX5_9AGAM|nr:unnamed protein product [Rhizoctonia solani]
MMNAGIGTTERPKKLVVIFSGYSGSSHEAGTIPTDLQLIHNPRLPWIEKVSRFDRLVHRLKFKKEKKSQIDEPVAGAYTFVSRNYEPGNQVILIVDTILPRDEATLLEAAVILAGHLNNGTRPRHPLETEPSTGSNAPERPIPIHGVIVDGSYTPESISQLSDQLKSRFPRGVEHIVCFRKEHNYSCSTISNPHGHIIAREMCFYSDGLWPHIFTVFLFFPLVARQLRAPVVFDQELSLLRA